MDDISGLDLVQSNSKYIFISHKLILYYLQKAYAVKSVWIGTQPLQMDMVAFSFPKHSPLFKPISYQFSCLRNVIRNKIIIILKIFL